jgi:hypothetical protein
MLTSLIENCQVKTWRLFFAGTSNLIDEQGDAAMFLKSS